MCPRSYEVRVTGDPDSLARIRDLDAVSSVEPDVTTVLTGSFADDEALAAALRRLRAHGLEVVEIRRSPDPDPGPGTGTEPPP